MLQRKNPDQSPNSAASEQPPPTTFPKGDPFPGEEHLRTLNELAMTAMTSSGKDSDSLATYFFFVARMVRNPDEVPLSPELIAKLGDGRRWLDCQGFTDPGKRYGTVLEDLSRYWEESGAMGRFLDSLYD